MDDLIRLKNNSFLSNKRYDKNLRQVLGWETEDVKILKKSFGLLKGLLKKKPVSYQREMRKEWERK